MTAKSIFDRRKAFGAVICGMLCLLMLVGLAFLTETDAHAATVTASGTCGDNLTWELDDEGTLTISGSGAMNDWSTSFNSPWRSYRSSIKTVVIGDGVRSIGGRAFESCSSITSVTIGKGVKSIGSYAFCSCIGITEIQFNAVAMNDLSSRNFVFFIEGGVEEVKLTIGKDVTRVPAYLFHPDMFYIGTLRITSVEFEEGSVCKSIGDCAFYYRDHLKSITIPSSVTSIGSEAFYGCSSLTSVHISDIVAWCKINFGDEYSNPLYYAKKFYLNENLVTELVIPDSVTSIKNYVFFNCGKLTSITIPNSVTSIGNSSFSNCSMLPNITIPDSVTSIGVSAFSCCSSLTGITIPEGVTSIGDNAFYKCSSLTNITIPDSVTCIGKYAFQHCKNLTSIVVPNSVTNIEIYAFDNCINLKLVLINSLPVASSTSSYSACGYLAKNATAIAIKSDITTISSYITSNFKKVDTLTIDGVKYNVYSKHVHGEDSANWTIVDNGDKVCSQCGLTIAAPTPEKIEGMCGKNIRWSFEKEAGVLNITGNGAMNDYSGTTMPWYALGVDIKKVVIGEGVTSIGKNAFNNEKAGFMFTEVILPSTLTSIGKYAFYNCSSLTEIAIPASVETIGRFAFRRSGLTNVTFDGTNAWSIGDEGTFSFANAVNALVNRYYDKAWTNVDSDDAISVIAVGKCGKTFDWMLSGDGVLTITGDGAMLDFGTNTAPWARYKVQIKSVVIGEGVIYIGNCAFYQCVNIESVTFASSVTKIGDYVFYGCSSLGKVTIPASVEYIGKYTFRKSCITSVSFENAISWRINGLGDALELADEATSAALLKANYKDAWIRIGNGDETLIAFGDCGDDVDWTLSGDGMLTVFGDGEMYDFSANTVPWASYKAQIKNVVICEGITSIGNCAFYDCANITSITLPSSLTGIGNYAFYGCKGLTEITVPASVTSIGAYAFRKCNALTVATFENAEGWSYGDATADIDANALKTNYKSAWTRA